MGNEEFHKIKAILNDKSFLSINNDIYEDQRIEDYCSNFGLQWTKFAKTQFDSSTGFSLTKKRLLKASEWDLGNLKDKLVIEIGSGAGRFTEILLSSGAYVVSIEMSDAIYSNHINNKSDKIIFIKSSLYDLDFLNNMFDYVLCYGVAQHTPDLIKTYKSCCNFAKQGGKISIDHYIKVYHPSPFSTPKYFWRPITKRMRPELLLKIVSFYIPYYFPVDTFLKKKLPVILSKLIRGCIPIPCWNYSGENNFPKEKEKLIEWAIMDTFDALGAKYDKPLRLNELKKITSRIELQNCQVKKGGNGLVFNAKK